MFLQLLQQGTVVTDSIVTQEYTAKLILTNLTTGQTFSVWDIPASDIVIKQSEKEKELDYGFVTIKDTVFGFHGVKNCSALREYIKENYR